jgi:hypothetical protein
MSLLNVEHASTHRVETILELVVLRYHLSTAINKEGASLSAHVVQCR